MIPIERLKKVEIFQNLDDDELKVVARFCQEETIPEGHTLFEEEDKAVKLFILEEGAVSIRFKKGVTFAIQTPGRILGWSFLVPPNRYTASGVTIRPSKMLVIKSPDFYALIQKDQKMGLKIMNNLARVVASRMKAFVDYY
jgi:CRP/FNR family cyclic AMP-dependent transcriptional regulator